MNVTPTKIEPYISEGRTYPALSADLLCKSDTDSGCDPGTLRKDYASSHFVFNKNRAFPHYLSIIHLLKNIGVSQNVL